MDIRGKLKEVIAQTLGGLGVSVEPIKISLEHPAELKNGDYSSSVALQYTKQAGMAPRALAEKIVVALGEIDGVSKIEVAGAGFINFYLTPQTLAESLDKARTEDMWGSIDLLKGKKILVEYTQPNPFKEFHIGHLMGNTIGESIARLLEFSGAQVIRANYQGDLGVHVACAIWGIKRLGINPATADEFGSAYAAGATAYKDDAGAKVEIDEINKKLYERSDPDLNALYDAGRKKSLEAFERIYAILGTKFDHYFFESETGPIGKEIVLAHPDVFPESDGARVFKGEEFGLHTRVFINAKGLPTYEAKELGLEKLKKDIYPETSLLIIETANEITEYFRVVKKALEFVYPEIAKQLEHLSHGIMKLPSGKMSSRTGTAITGESLLNELADAARERAAESRAKNHDTLAQQIAVAAIKYQILKQASGKDIIFDRERALSLEGDSGPYLQYAHARAQQIVEKAEEQNVAAKIDANTTPDNLTRLLHRFPEIVEYAASLREPHVLTSYLLEIASAFNSWYAQVHILDGSADAPHKVALADAVRKTLKNGLWILAIPTPEKM